MTYSQVWCRALASGPGFGCSCWVMAPALQFLLQSKGTESVLFKKKKKKMHGSQNANEVFGHSHWW